MELTDFLLFLPFIVPILFMFGWSSSRLLTAFRQSVIWKEETVEVKKSLQDELPFFTYTLNGKTITSDRLPDDVNDGDSITFIFPPGEPEKAKEKSSQEGWGYSFVIFLSACFFSSMLVWMVIDEHNDIKHRDELRALKTTGRKIIVPLAEATVESTGGDEDHIGHYWINVKWEDPATHKTFEFKSEQFYFNFTEQLAAKREVIIYVDPQNDNRYYMDISFTPAVTLHNENPPHNESLENDGRGWTCLIFGLIVASGGFFMLYMQYQMVNSGIRTTGKVLRLITRRNSSGYAYHPFVQFTTENGATVQVELSEGANPPAYEIGDSLPVFYQQDKPDNAISIQPGFIVMYAVFTTIGLALMMGGIYFFME